MPFVNANFLGTQYHMDFENLVCETCGFTSAFHQGLRCPNPSEMVRSPFQRPPTVCEKVKTLYERQPYYKTIKGNKSCVA